MHFGPKPRAFGGSIQQGYLGYKRKITQFEGVLVLPSHRMLWTSEDAQAERDLRARWLRCLAFTADSIRRLRGQACHRARRSLSTCEMDPCSRLQWLSKSINPPKLQFSTI